MKTPVSGDTYYKPASDEKSTTDRSVDAERRSVAVSGLGEGFPGGREYLEGLESPFEVKKMF